MSGKTFLSKPNFRFTTDSDGNAVLQSTRELYTNATLFSCVMVALCVFWALQSYWRYSRISEFRSAGSLLLHLVSVCGPLVIILIMFFSRGRLWQAYSLSLRSMSWRKEDATLKVTFFPAWRRPTLMIDKPFELILDEDPEIKHLIIRAKDSDQELLKLCVDKAVDPALQFCKALEADGVPFTHNVPSWRTPESRPINQTERLDGSDLQV